MGVARNIVMDPRLVPGGGTVEIEVSRALAGAWQPKPVGANARIFQARASSMGALAAMGVFS
jgi:chaperonin GroEL (HSP60 family)